MKNTTNNKLLEAIKRKNEYELLYLMAKMDV